MGIVVSAALALMAVLMVTALFLKMPAAGLANGLRLAGPVLLGLFGGVLLFFGRAGLGIPLIGLALALYSRSRPVGMSHASTGRRSTVRSAMFDMELDHDTGEMDGMILTGNFEGHPLSSLDEEDLLLLLEQTAQDPDSRALLEAYLDRRVPRWREHAQAHTDSGEARPSGSGPMTKEEAYQILGLQPGAATNEIREAHRRLMKRLHPDSGGSTFLASKINEAKDVLLG